MVQGQTYPTYTWDIDLFSSSNWSWVGNWAGFFVAPGNNFNAHFVFTGTAQTNNTNDRTGGTAHSISFSNGAGAFVIGGNAITLTGGITNNSANLQTLNLPIGLSAGSHTVHTASTGSITLGGVVSGSGGLTKTGGQTLTLNGSNTFQGTTLVSAGTLALGHVNALQNSTLDTGTSGSQQVTFTVSGSNTYNLGGLQGADALAFGANSLRIGANNASTTYSGSLGGTGGITKTGTGTLALTGSSSYNGSTTVSAGTLRVNGSVSSRGISVGAGGSLGGTGTVISTANASVISGGLHTGVLNDGAANSLNIRVTGGSLAINGTTSLELISASSNDLISFADSTITQITVGGTLSVSALNPSFLVRDRSWQLFNWAGITTVNGAFASYDLPNLDSGLSWDVSKLYTTGYLSIAPEPSRMLLLGLGASLLLFRRRRAS